jgi:subtilisin-like proprotein convertase family protein
MKKQFLLFALACGIFANVSAQNTKSYFKALSQDQVSVAESTQRGAFPSNFDTYQLDYSAVKSALATAPKEFTAAAKSGKCVVSIPIANGLQEEFVITEIAMLDEAGTIEFPDIHTYSGISKTDPRRVVRLSTTARGFRAMVVQPDYTVSFVEPYAWGQTEYYIAFHGTDAPDNGLQKLRTEVLENGEIQFGEDHTPYAPSPEYRGGELEPVKMKIYRLAVGATGEFTQDHGGTKALAFAAITEYINYTSFFYERDLTLRTQLIAASQNAVFTDPNTDPYPGTLVLGWYQVNPEVINTYCNVNSHDVGHVLGRYMGGGILGVGLPGVCLAQKANGCSAGNGNGDYGGGFLGVLGQELGHQLDGGHTWNRCGGGGGRDGSVAFEPGSGSTIMSYAGACGTDNVQGYTDLYYHAGSIGQIKQYYIFGAVCGSYQQTTNHQPIVTLPYQNNFFIPISTPFELTGSATDMDGDTLSYCWEEIDAGPETPLGDPQGNAAIFRTRPPQAAANRYFPKLNTVIANTNDITEQLPTYSRDLTFRLTVRDNQPNGGGVGQADVGFKAYEGAGPFKVNQPNTTATTWRVGEYAQVTWDVANTNVPPVSCQKVNIRLSIDGGQTYPITLASGVTNNGSYYVLVPNNLGSTMRVRVDAAENVFFDISNANFKIQQPTQPSLTLGLENSGGIICLPDNYETSILSAGVLGFNDPINLEVTGTLPPGAIPSFTTTTMLPGQPATFKLDLSNVAVEGQYTFNIRATSGSLELIRPVTLLLRRNDFSGFALQTPPNGLTNAGLTQTLRWSKGLDADAYDVEFSKSPAFTTILATKSGTALDSFKINFLLEKGTAYFWRVRSVNECGAHAWSEPYFFSTFAEDCRVFEATDLPKNLSASSTPTIESKITVNQGGAISNLTIKQIDGYHEFFKNLEAHLISPTGTDVMLWKDKCGNFNGSFNFGLDDAAPGGFPCPPNNTGNIYRPLNPLAPFIGETSTGTWTLRIKDNEIGSGGTLEAFKLEFCATLDINPPYLVNNNVMPVPTGSNRVITPDFLLVEDANNTHAQLVYTVMSVPEDGIITRNNFGALKQGDQFTQANLDAGEIRFYDYGGSPAPDGFRFMVTDGEHGFFGTPKFLTQPATNSQEPIQQNLDFVLFPNPASEMVHLSFGQALLAKTQVQLLDIAGRQMGSWNLGVGESALSIGVNSLPKGVYLVTVHNETGRGLRKLVVQ